MSRSPTEVVLEGFSAWEQGDFETFMALVHPEIEIWVLEGANADSYQGIDSVPSWITDWSSAWGEISYEPIEFTDHGSKLLAAVRTRGTGAGSGIEVDEVVWWGFEVEDALIRRVWIGPPKESVLAATGLADA